jgi:hypothetical protein
VEKCSCNLTAGGIYSYANPRVQTVKQINLIKIYCTMLYLWFPERNSGKLETSLLLKKYNLNPLTVCYAYLPLYQPAGAACV